MSKPYKLKYKHSDFPFKGTPLAMYGGMKDSPMRSWWSKVKEKMSGAVAKGKGFLGKVFGGGGGGEVEGGGVSSGGVPQHGPEAHTGGSQSGQGKWGGLKQGGGSQGGNLGLSANMGTGGMGEEGVDPTQTGSQKWRGQQA